MPVAVRTFQVSDGVIAGETTPDTESLYVSPSELESLFGCGASEEQLRFVHSLIAAHTNRASLWPCEYLEELPIPSGRQETQVSVTPLISISDAAGRYAPGRRDRLGYGAYNYGYNQILALTSAVQPQWSPIDVSAIEIVAAAGIVYLPTTFYFVPWSLVRLRYLAGYTVIPARVKAAVAELLNSMSARGVSDRTRRTVGRVSSSYVSDSFITPMARELLAPFVVQSYF